MKHTLRPAAAADSLQVAALLIETRAEFMPYAPSAHTDSEIRTWVASYLIPTGGVIVAEADGKVVGAVATELNGQVSWITQMAVAPTLTDQGIGSRLLAAAMRSLANPVRLYTFQANAGARRFYERHGFCAIEFTDGQDNEERCPDVLYEFGAHRTDA